jgi:hypothetical protein
MSADQRNMIRLRAINLSRHFRDLFWTLPLPTRAIWRWLFLTEGGATVRRSGERALADLAEFCFAKKSTFDSDPLVMARRNGRRDVWLRITNYLNLDEDAVQKIMEIDDGY